MFNTSQNNKMVEVLSGPERHRRRTPQEKIAIIQQTMEPGDGGSRSTVNRINADF